MLTEPLPKSLDVRKAAGRGASVSGEVKPAQLAQFREYLASDEGTVQVVLEFSRDEENRYLIHVVAEADGLVTCQRCMESMPLRVTTDNVLAVVWTDEQASHLPRHLDPLIVPEDEACNLWELVEEELILGLPPFSYHDTEECKEILAGYTQPPADEEVEKKPNPFNVLEQLKPGSKH